MSPETRASIRALYFGELGSVSAIARALGLSRSAVAHALVMESAFAPHRHASQGPPDGEASAAPPPLLPGGRR